MRNENATSVKRHREAGRFTTCDSDVPASFNNVLNIDHSPESYRPETSTKDPDSCA